MIRDATAADAAAIAALYAPYVRETAISFEDAPPDAAEMARRIAASPCWLIAEEAGMVAGYAYATAFRARAAYAWVVETSVYVATAACGRGHGRRLYDVLLGRLQGGGYVAAVGVIALPNPASVTLHERCGFVHVGTQPALGFKQGRWWDVGYWQRDFGPRPAAPEAT